MWVQYEGVVFFVSLSNLHLVFRGRSWIAWATPNHTKKFLTPFLLPLGKNEARSVITWPDTSQDPFITNSTAAFFQDYNHWDDTEYKQTNRFGMSAQHCLFGHWTVPPVLMWCKTRKQGQIFQTRTQAEIFFCIKSDQHSHSWKKGLGKATKGGDSRLAHYCWWKTTEGEAGHGQICLWRSSQASLPPTLSFSTLCFLFSSFKSSVCLTLAKSNKVLSFYFYVFKN